MRAAPTFASLVLLVAAGCGGSSRDDFITVDASVRDAETQDAELQDAGSADLGDPAEDAGSEDAGAEDAGAEDAGAEDAGAEDAGSEDAGAEDAGDRDGGFDGGATDVGDGGPADLGIEDGGADASVDAGVGDAGAPDASDAGPAADGGPSADGGRDGGVFSDGGAFDAGDGGLGPDGGSAVTDGGPLDASTDAAIDAGPSDAGDASTGDAGPSDASIDAGDAGPSDVGFVCGNGTQDPGEVCDDGNLVDGDGCNSDCDVSGRLLWSSTLGGTSTELGRGAGVFSGGDLLAAGGWRGDLWFARYRKSNGVQIYRTQINGPAGFGDVLNDVAVDSTDGFAVVGEIDGTNAGGDIFVRRYDSTRSIVWTSTAGGTGTFDNDFALSVDVSSSGEVLVGGLVDTSTPGWVRKYDAMGNIAWTRTSTSLVNGVAFANNGDVYVVGSDEYFQGARRSREIVVEKLDSRGQVLWTRRQRGGDNQAIANAVDVAPNGDVVVTGFVDTTRRGDRDIWVRRYSSSGQTLWTDTQGTAAFREDEGRGIAVASNGDVIVVGFVSDRFPTGDDLWWVRRYFANGTVSWTETVTNNPPNGQDHAEDVAIASDGTIYVVGTVEVCDRTPCPTTGASTNDDVRVEARAP